jgi:hypothetical protein
MRLLSFIAAFFAAIFAAGIAGAGANMALGWRPDSQATVALVIVVYVLVFLGLLRLRKGRA